MVLMQFFLACTLSSKHVPLKTSAPHDIFVVSTLDKLDERRSIALPSSLQTSIEQEITGRGLSIQTLDLNDSFSSQRNTSQREKLYPNRPLLLIETQAQFYSQLEGRFRWTVDVQLSLRSAENTYFSRSFSVPVFHQFHHQREEEALEAAQELILRQLRGLLDDYIRGEAR